MAKDKKIGVAIDFSKSSKSALRWSIDHLADKGDTFYILHVKPYSPDDSQSELWAQSGSRTSIFLHSFSNLRSEISRSVDFDFDFDLQP